jgi:hypothetical protein
MSLHVDPDMPPLTDLQVALIKALIARSQADTEMLSPRVGIPIALLDCVYMNIQYKSKAGVVMFMPRKYVPKRQAMTCVP